MSDTQALVGDLTGELVTPADGNWDEARAAWNLAVDQRPAAVVFPETADDVVAAVRFARRAKLRVAAQSTGHAAAPMGSLEDTLLVKMGRLRAVEIDAQAQTARVEGGAQWQDVVAPAAEHGLAALAGSAADVGVAGFTQGGGIGWLGRKYGLSCNSVLAAEIVTVDGELVRADAETNPDLFWALRGGGGNFGVVTALELRLYPLATVYAGMLAFPQERASEVLAAWRDWLPDVPDELSSCGRILNVPPLPEIPEPVRGKSFVVVEVAYAGDEDAGASLVAPLRELGPALDTVATIPVPMLAMLHMDPPEPVPGVGDGMLMDELPDEAIDALVQVAGPESGTPLISVEFRHLGGAYADARAEHGALASVDSTYAMYAVGMAMTPEMGMAVTGAVGAVKGSLGAWESDFAYLNFAEQPVGDRLLPPAAWQRLREVKAKYDPENLFRANHQVPPAD